MKEKIPVYKKWWFWIIIMILVISLMNHSRRGSSPVQTEVAPSEDNSAEAASVSEPQTTEEQLTAILDSIGLEYSDLKIVNGIPDSDRYQITYHYDETSWDETYFVNDCLSDYIDICSQAYQIDGINNIELYVYTDLMDEKGNEMIEKGFSMSMLKDKYSTYNWENLKYIKGKYSIIEADSEFITVHPAVKKNVKFDEVMYK